MRKEQNGGIKRREGGEEIETWREKDKNKIKVDRKKRKR